MKPSPSLLVTAAERGFLCERLRSDFEQFIHFLKSRWRRPTVANISLEMTLDSAFQHHTEVPRRPFNKESFLNT